ncbi:hypothetical protein ACFSTJ_11355 [Ottowia pentelensis]|uniref:hypothetical protein n=1 Tax=Ottowia pentelensis TaxID=511108 RepID=UPI0036261691
MNEEQDPKPGGRFLSKVVKFITSPTTDWADLNKVDGPLDASESSAALKEMIERKRRNDFVRNREFDMLRKARRRQLAGAHGGSASPTSFISSVESAHPHEPERTLEKIDQIEEQMSRAWLDRAEPTAVAPDNPRAYDKTRPVKLDEMAAGAGFGVTAVEVPLSGAAAEVSRGEAAPHPSPSRWTRPPAPTRGPTRSRPRLWPTNRRPWPSAPRSRRWPSALPTATPPGPRSACWSCWARAAATATTWKPGSPCSICTAPPASPTSSTARPSPLSAASAARHPSGRWRRAPPRAPCR